MDLNTFELTQVLSSNVTEKRITLLGKFKEKQGQAIIIVMSKVPDNFQFDVNQLTQIFTNDIYSSFQGKMMNKVEIQIIYPINEKHKNKYRKKLMVLEQESAIAYEQNKQELLKKQLSHISWVKNIVQGKAEVERVLFRCPNFLILPDFKCTNLQQKQSLHLLTIFADESLCSIRDLRGKHIKLLEQVKQEVDNLLVDKLKMVKNSYRLYFHYPPTFYRLHIHIMALSLGSMAALVDRAHSVENVINNLKVDSEYYGKVSLLKLIQK